MHRIIHHRMDVQKGLYRHLIKRAISSGIHRNLSREQQLMSFLLTYRTSPHSTTGVSPCKLFFNRDLRTRLDLLLPNVRRRVEEKQGRQMRQHDSHARARDLTVGQRVMVSWSSLDTWHCGETEWSTHLSG